MQRRGFTLLEVLTVIFIFGVLVSISGYVYSSALARSRDNTRKSDLQTIKNALEQFYLDNKAYPGFETRTGDQIFTAKWQLDKNNSSSCSPTKQKFLTPSYLSSVPEDPQSKLGTGNCASLGLSTALFGQYLYFGLPKDSSRTGFVLVARMERGININMASLGADVYSILNDPVTGKYSSQLGNLSFNNIINSSTSHNYFITSLTGRNN